MKDEKTKMPYNPTRDDIERLMRPYFWPQLASGLGRCVHCGMMISVRM